MTGYRYRVESDAPAPFSPKWGRISVSGWAYIEPEEHDFVVDMWFRQILNLASFDSFLEELGPCAYQAELIRWRGILRELWKAGADEYALEGWGQAINLAWKHYKWIGVLQPLAQARDKALKAQSAAGKKPRQSKRDTVLSLWVSLNKTDKTESAKKSVIEKRIGISRSQINKILARNSCA